MQWVWHKPSVWQESDWVRSSQSTCSWSIFLKPNPRMNAENFTRKGWAPTVTVRDGSLWTADLLANVVDICCVFATILIPYFWCKYTISFWKTIPFQLLAHAVSVKLVPSLVLKVDTWLRSKPIRISLSPIHVIGSVMSIWCLWRHETVLKWPTDAIC